MSPAPSLLHRLRLLLLESFSPAPRCDLVWDEAAAAEWLLAEMRIRMGGAP